MSEHTESSASLRLFAALPLPRELRDALAGWSRDKLRKTFPMEKWVHPEDYHLTLKFLGGTPADRMPAVREALALVAAGTAPFGLALDGLGTFGRPGLPAVLWAGVRAAERSGTGAWSGLADRRRQAAASGGGPDANGRAQPSGSAPPSAPAPLARLAEAVEAALVPLGYLAEPRAYRPHVTLARRWSAPHAPDRALLAAPPPAALSAPWAADRLVLYRSRLGQAPMYEPLAEFLFGNRENG